MKLNKKILKLSLTVLMSTLILFSTLTIELKNTNTIYAKNELTNSPYETYTIGFNSELTESPIAYEGVKVINMGFSDPRDICIKNNIAYIADKGNKVIYKYDIETASTTIIGENILKGPTGICVTDDFIYVADYDAKIVFKFDLDGNEIKKYERPTEPLFGVKSEFRPTKVAVDRRGNLYITSDGNANGIIQLNDEGEFVGYFGPNTINVTLSLLLKRMLLPKKDRETYASLTPKVTTNLAIDSKNIVYTVIDNEAGVSIKKYNVNGTNILPVSVPSNSYQDITVDDLGFIYTVDKSDTNVVKVMNDTGSLLFTFGQTKTGSISLGQFDKAVGIATDSNYNIWVLDSGGKNIQIFRKTEFANTVFNAISSYNQGDYENATIYYKEILTQNASFAEACIGLGRIAQRYEDYDTAEYYFKIANYKAGYSEVFWEQRDKWIGNNLVWIILLIIVFIILKSFKVFEKLIALTPKKIVALKDKINSLKITDELKYLFRILKKPNDVFYDIKYLLKVKVKTAVLVLGLFIFVNIIGSYFIAGYLFKPTSLANVNLAFEILKWGLIIILFVFGNYLVSTLQSSEAFFRDIFIGAIFAFAPVILFKLPLDLISNVLSYNEAYIYNLGINILWIWSIINLILMLKEMHNYTVKELIINIILTIIAVVILVLLYLVIYILSMQLFDFIIGLIKEGGFR